MKYEPFRGWKLALLSVALGLGTFIQILDSAIANVAVPSIAGTLSVSIEEGTWVITSFAAANAIVLPLTGWLSDFFGRVRLFVTSIILFSIASFLCGFSTSLTMLVFFRVVQGAVAGSLIPLSLSLLLNNSSKEHQGPVLGFWAMIVVVAPVVGPILGGYITETYSWPWIFYINVPIGFFSALVTWSLLSNRESKIVRNPIDWFGLVLLTIGVGCLQVMLDKGKDLDWFNSTVITSLATISVISLVYFSVWNYYAKHPIVDFTFFTDRNFVLGSTIITLGFLLFFGSSVLIPLWLQTQQGYTAFWAGVSIAPIGIFPVLFSMVVGRFMYLTDLRKLTMISFLTFSITFFYQSNFVTEITLEKIMLARLLQGIGLTLFFIPLVQISLTNIPPDRYASASGVFNFIRILVGSGFGTSLMVYFWTRFQAYYFDSLSEAITPYRSPPSQLFDQFTGGVPSKTPGISMLVERMVGQQASVLALDDIFWISGWIFLAMAPIPFLCKRVKKGRFSLVTD